MDDIYIRSLRDQINLIYGPPMNVLSNCLRSFISAPPGHDLVAFDFNAIESRVLAWLAGEEWKLKIYRKDGKIYEANAALIYNIPISEVTKEQRQIGKVAELALGYGGGKGAFKLMAHGLKIKVKDAFAEEIKVKFRNKHKSTVHFWHELENGAKKAFIYPKTKISVGTRGRQIHFLKNGSFLWCQLPSKRVLCYPYPKILDHETPWGENRPALSYMTVDSFSRKWTRVFTYGGKLAENITQATSRCLLRDAMVRLDEKGFEISMHVHDEIVCEVPKNQDKFQTIKNIILKSEPWAKTIPLSAGGWRGERYRK